MYSFYTFFFDLFTSQTGAYMDTFCWNSCTGLAAVPAPCVHFFAASCWPGKGAFPRRYRWEYVLFVVYIIRRISSENWKKELTSSQLFSNLRLARTGSIAKNNCQTSKQSRKLSWITPAHDRYLAYQD